MILAIALAAATADSSWVGRPHFDHLLTLQAGFYKDFYFRGTDYWARALLDPTSYPKEGARVGKAVWKQGKLDAQHNLVTGTFDDPVYADWTEPKPRKAIVQLIATGRCVLNGRLVPLDVHADGWQLTPVLLKKGKNTILTTSALAFGFNQIAAPLCLSDSSVLAPDPKPGESGPFLGSVVAINASDRSQKIDVKSQVDDGPIITSQTEPVPAMECRIVRFSFRSRPDLKVGNHRLKLWADKRDVTNVDLNVPGPTGLYRRTYISRFDHMVRCYAVLPCTTGAANKPIFMFTYGGGALGCQNLLANFHPKPDCSIVVPEFRTNNWDGYCRREALESLDQAAKELHADRTRTYLIGHSMGGHGAYQIASLNPAAFAGVGASAGWLSMFDYYNPLMFPPLDLADPVSRIFETALDEVHLENRLDALAKVQNIAIVHGDKDRAVPIKTQTYFIRDELKKRGVDVTLFVRPGADHFWNLPDGQGNQYDFPPLFQTLLSSPHRGNGRYFDEPKLPACWQQLLDKPFVAVYGTHGSALDTQLAHDRATVEGGWCRAWARLDVEIAPDTVPLSQLAGKNVILYGTPKSNRLWKLHPTAAKILRKARQKGLKPTAWLIEGRRNGDVWAAVGGVDTRACKLAYFVNPDRNDFPFPEWTLFNEGVLTKGLKGVLGAGFNDGREGWRTP